MAYFPELYRKFTPISPLNALNSFTIRMNSRFLLAIIAVFSLSTQVAGQINFLNQTDLLTPSTHFSGVAIAIADMNGDGRDDIVRLSNGVNLSIEYQTSAGRPFLHSASLGQMGSESQWGMCVADVNNDGVGDVMAGGYYDGVKFTTSTDLGGYSVNTMMMPETFVQGVNFADVNNDGWLDAFVCHDDGVARIFGNNGDGTFTFQPNWIDLTTTPSSDNSGNYGSVWSDIDNDGDVDLYIAKCRQGVNSSTDPRRINQLFINNGDGTYTQDISNWSGLRIGAQSWTADFGDVDNDGDFDCFITNHDVSSQLLINDGSGHFTDITQNAGLFNIINGLPIQGVFRDFDNDGFVDILVAGSAQYLFHNNGDLTFTAVEDALGTDQMESFAIGDLNADGFQDIYAGYANIYTDPSNTPDKLWINEGNGNGFFGLNLNGTASNRNAVGAKVKIHTAAGIQIREVRSGESYGISNSLQIHFGLGQQASIDSIEVFWPSGHRDVLFQPEANQYATLYEGGCFLPQIEINSTDPLTFCTGDTIYLDAPAGFAEYLWNTGATSPQLAVTGPGAYQVTVTPAGGGCSAASQIITTYVDPVQTPVIEVSGATTFCQGGVVTLSAPESPAYLWSTGATTRQIQVSEAGAYHVATQGLCSSFQSAPVEVVVLSPGGQPVITTDTVGQNQSATLVADGDLIRWADAPEGLVLSESDTLHTTPLSATTTFWVQNSALYDQPNEYVGMENHAGTNFSDQSFNGSLIFDAYESFTLARVKVYTNVSANRKIELLSSSGEVLQSAIVFIPTGTQVVELNFSVPVGANMQLTTNAEYNQTAIGSISPQLRRSSQNVAFPYQIEDVVSIHGTNFGSDRYYYFFNWEIDFNGQICPGEWYPVTAVVDSTIVGATERPNTNDNNEIFIYPNPTNGQFWVELSGNEFVEGQLTVQNMLGQTVLTKQVKTGKNLLDLTSFAAGTYGIEWQSGDLLWKGKIIRQ